ncbi:nitrophenyl compound nitroreductase subunit ArsF family protein [Odoribacter sp. OttesenSCG-928-J03]|nr:nitrophenyl compound nitroreductase subunit ArsF family protein [Odoribacter sp. OttesenSCG-928-J03]
MIKSILLGLVALLFVACGGNTPKNNQLSSGSAETKTQSMDTSTVNVYYFHGKQRCKTCMAVGEVTEKSIKELYAGNSQVKFTEVKTDEIQNTSLVEKYEVTWNALIIAKGDDHIEITQEAFANALNNSEKLTDLIKTEVDKRL